MTGKTADFWQEHSLNYLNMAFGESKNERISNPDGYSKQINQCGDSIEFFIVGTLNCLEYVSYNAKGCINTETCANTVSHMACGKSVIQAKKIDSEQVISFLETLPAHESHCADLAVATFLEALGDFLQRTKVKT